MVIAAAGVSFDTGSDWRFRHSSAQGWNAPTLYGTTSADSGCGRSDCKSACWSTASPSGPAAHLTLSFFYRLDLNTATPRMPSLLFRRALLAAALSLTSTTRTAAQDTTYVVGATLIDGTGRSPLVNATITIANGRIVRVASDAPPKPSKRNSIIDARGKFITPGLMDANIHLVYGVSIEFLARYEGRFEELIAEAAQVALANGLTTIFDSWGPLKPLLTVRDRIARNEIPGSRLYVAGNIIGFTGPFGRDFNNAEKVVSTPFRERIDKLWEEGTGTELMWLTPDSLRLAIRAYIARGMDFLKYGVSGHTQMEMLMFSPEQQRVIIDEGRRAGLVVETHTTSVESLRQAIEAGVDLMQHCSITGRVRMPESTLALLKTRGIACTVGLVTETRLAAMVASADGYPRRVYWGELVKTQAENEKRLIAEGVPLLLATDAGIMNPDEHDALPEAMKKDEDTRLGEAHFTWLKASAQKGLKPMDAILAATSNIAKAYHKDRDVGTLEAGKRADLLVLDADPLADINNLRRIGIVMKDGRVVDRAALPVKRVLTRPGDTGFATH